MLIWLPKVKTDPEGRGTVRTVKSTKDSGCLQEFLHSLMDSRSNDGPLFCHLDFVPTQTWALKWIRARMTELGKDPRWYSIRSIRQGGSSTACEVEMPELFLLASGRWKGNALERYRKDRLPTEQARFAELLSSQ